MSRRLLIVDDEESMLEFLSLLFAEESYEVTTASSVATAREQLQNSYDLVLCDIMMPDGNGLDLLKEIKQENPSTSVIMMTAYTSSKSHIEAMRHGAYGYISKPFDVDELKVVVEKALESTDLIEENLYLKREIEQRHVFSQIIGKSSRMQAVFKVIERVARTASTVLIQGESGTGKELIARAIHHASPRRERNFLSVNCGALPENLLESELFGHERGAFTGAVKDKKGLFQEAEGGSLFLDEIGEMSTAMQVKLLRALQERTIRKVGGSREEAVDVRIVAATNRDLMERVEEGEFREDLFYRINVIPIQLPPLRTRREDIPLLTVHFLEKYSREMGIDAPQISVEAMNVLESYDWPGNVRELENTIERIMALSMESTVTTRELPMHLVAAPQGHTQLIELPEDGLDLESYLDEIRVELMRQALDRTEGVQTQAAEILGMTFRSFRYYAKKAGLTGAGERGEGSG
ncbi:MAG: sigma-54 dependent transcriptional regulator [Acidobacteriota bacterium]